MSKSIDLAGQRFGRIVVVVYSHSQNGSFWHCRCDCGNLTIVSTRSLRYGSTKSCGCGSKEQGVENFQAAGVRARGKYWPHTRRLKDMRRNMLRRCYDPRDKRFPQYGGRGIQVCDEWRSSPDTFFSFAVSHGWAPSLTIERNDVDGHYEPGNVSFADRVVQMNNTTRNRYVAWNGETLTVAQWARKLGVSDAALQHRFTRNWSIERALTQPFRRQDAQS